MSAAELEAKLRGLERMRVAGLISEANYAVKSAELRAQLAAAPPPQKPLGSPFPQPSQPAAPIEPPAAQLPQWSPPQPQLVPPPAESQAWTPAAPQNAHPDAPPGYPPPAYPPPAYPATPAQPSPAPRKASRLRTVIASLVVTGLLGGGVAAYGVLSRHRDSAAAGAGATAAPKQPVPDAVAQFIPVAEKFVEDHRGLKFIHAVAVTMLDDTAFEQKLTGGPAPSKQASTGATKMTKELRALHLITGSTNLDGGTSSGLSSGVSGFYDPKSKELYVRGTTLTPYAREVVVHELTHALQDQHFGLWRPELTQSDDERFAAFQAVYEGDARNVEDQYVASEPLADQQAAQKQDSAGSSGVSNVPKVLLELVGFPYSAGPQFVKAVLAAKGQQGLDDAFNTPPTTTAQILDPSRFLAAQGALSVADPAVGGAAFDKGVFGELGFVLLFNELVDSGKASHEQALTSAATWGGDRYVAWDQGDKACFRVSVVAVTPELQPVLDDGLREFARDTPGASVSASGGGPATLTVCG
jgi:hypothetical protein